MIDCPYNITAILQNPGANGPWYKISSFRKLLTALDDDEARYGGRPDWDPWIKRAYQRKNHGTVCGSPVTVLFTPFMSVQVEEQIVRVHGLSCEDVKIERHKGWYTGKQTGCFSLDLLRDSFRQLYKLLLKVSRVDMNKLRVHSNMVWGAAALYIIAACSWQEFSEMLDYWRPAISSTVDAGYWWAQIPALAFIGGVICFGVVISGYNLLSRILN